MAESLKSKTLKGISWSAIERFSVQGVNFIIQIVLARLLLPSDYGIIGMLAIFLQIAQVFIDSGFANALIQKSHCTNRDYSTVFYYNLFISVSIYLLFYIIAPYVSLFYNNEALTLVMRIISITLVINALSIIHKTILVKDVDFKRQSKVSFSCAVISGIIGIICAHKGMGVYALCIQQILNSVLTLFMYSMVVKWKPLLVFDKLIFKELFSFGSKLLAASLIGVIYKNLYTIIIGKQFSSDALGYYTRAEHFAMFPSNNIGLIISRVAYPVFSKIKDNNSSLRSAYSKMIKMSSMLIFPIMVILCAVAEPFIIVTLSDKWIDAVIILRILCIDWMLDHLSLINLNLLYVKGRSDYALKLEVAKKTIAITILLLSIPFGIIGMCWGRVVYSVIATVVNTCYTHRLINLSFLNQLRDFMPILILSVISGVVGYLMMNEFESQIIKLCIGVVTSILLYSGFCLTFYNRDLKTLINGKIKA